MNLGSNSVYPVKLRKYSDKASISTPGEYLEIPLSDDIEEIGLTKGDDLQMTLRKSGFESIRYLKISGNDLQDRGRVHSLSLKRNEDSSPSYAVSIPVEYSVHSDLSPFQGLEQDDTVIVELNSSSELIRVYQPSDYQNRLEELVESEATPDIRVPTVLAGLYQGKSVEQLYSENGKLRLEGVDRSTGEYVTGFDVEVFDKEDRLVGSLNNVSRDIIELPPGIYTAEFYAEGYNTRAFRTRIEPGKVSAKTIKFYPE
jgi:hypothetical protein